MSDLSFYFIVSAALAAGLYYALQMYTNYVRYERMKKYIERVERRCDAIYLAHNHPRYKSNG